MNTPHAPGWCQAVGQEQLHFSPTQQRSAAGACDGRGGALGGARARLWLTCTRMKSLEALEVVADVDIWAGSLPPSPEPSPPPGTMTILSPVLAIRI